MVNPAVSFSTNPDEQKYDCYVQENKLYFKFDIIDPNQGFECKFYLVFTTGNSISPSNIKSRIAGRIFGWEIKKAPYKRPIFYFFVDFMFYSIMGIFVSLSLLFSLAKAPVGKRFDKVSTINLSHEKRMNRIHKKYSLLNSKLRRKILFGQVVSFLPILLSILLAFYLATQYKDVSWSLAKQFGVAVDVAPLFPKVYH